MDNLQLAAHIGPFPSASGDRPRSSAGLMLLGLLLSAASAPGVASLKLPRRVSEFEFKHAAVAAVDEHFPGSDGPALLLTSFFPFGKDEIIAVPNLASVLHGAAANRTAISADARWPNQADAAPVGAIASAPNSSFVLAASGFFVSPAKSTGAITLFEVTDPANPKPTVLSTPRKGNFYHQAVWVDVNGDGRLDVLAARAYKSMNPLASAKGDLVWLEQPEVFVSGLPWKERQLTGSKGPGVAFAVADLDGDGKFEVIAAQFFAAQQLSVWWCEAETWSGCHRGKGVGRAVIDSAEHAPYFNVQWVDLDGDGRRELLATTNTANGRGRVLAFTPPVGGDFRAQGASWGKSVLAEGYSPKQRFLPGRGAPGTARAFVARQGDAKPFILVSADDAGYVDLLVPCEGESTLDRGSDASSLTVAYARHRVVNSSNTIGTPAIGDWDGDGVAEFAVPLFAENKVALYAFNGGNDGEGCR